MKKLIIAAAIVIGCSVFVSANTSNSTDRSKNCAKNENCVCVPTPDGGCICVPKSQAAAPGEPVESRSGCSNTEDCTCE